MLVPHPVFTLVAPLQVLRLFELIESSLKLRESMVFLRGDTVTLYGLQGIGEALGTGIHRQVLAIRPPFFKREQPLLRGAEQGIQACMKGVNLHGGARLKKGAQAVRHLRLQGEGTYTRKIMFGHGLSPVVVLLVLCLSLLRLVALRGLKPLPLRLPLCLPSGGLGVLLWRRLDLWAHVGIWIARAPHDTVTDLAFGHLHLLPVLRTIPELLLLRHVEPGEQRAGSRPESPQHLKTDETVHGYPSSWPGSHASHSRDHAAS